MDFNLLNKIIQDNDSFLITSHVNPDADAIGSEMALYFILKKLGKNAFVVNHSSTPSNLLFLDKDKVIEKYDPGKHDELIGEVDVLFALDLNQSNRLVKLEKAFMGSRGVKVCIDHHLDKGDFADHFFINTDSSATGQIIYEFIEATGIVEIDYDIALQVYAAIITDTGAFKYDRTTPEVHRIAAKLLETGVNPSDVFDKIYDQSRLGKIKLLGKALDSMELNETNEIASMTISREMLADAGALESEVDGFVNYCLAIENVKIGLLFFELRDGMKVSFRSKGKIPINKLAAEFNGGGHLNAAGTRLFDVNFSEYRQKVIDAARKYINGE